MLDKRARDEALRTRYDGKPAVPNCPWRGRLYVQSGAVDGGDACRRAHLDVRRGALAQAGVAVRTTLDVVLAGRYASVETVLLLLANMIPVLFVIPMVTSALYAQGLGRTVLGIAVVNVVTSVTLFGLLRPRFGLLGAAAAWMTAEAWSTRSPTPSVGCDKAAWSAMPSLELHRDPMSRHADVWTHIAEEVPR
jgi:hypothetical protein